MSPSASWVAKLRTATGLRVEPAEAEIEGLRPGCVVEPETLDQVAEVLSHASQESLAVVPMGGGTLLHLGNPPSGADILLSTASLRVGFTHSPQDLVATVPGGMTVAEANASLDGGQILPLAPPLPMKATIGGALASDVSGPRTQGLGRPRNSLLGVKVLLPDGSVTKAGGRVVKNVSGYDLGKLYVGSLGTLGILVEATFKLRPLPETLSTLAFSFPTIDGAVRAAREVLEAAVEPSAITVVDGATASELKLGNAMPHLLVELGDLLVMIRRQVREITDIAVGRGGKGPLRLELPEDLWEEVAGVPLGKQEVVLRVAVPSADVETMVVDGLETLSSTGPWRVITHPGLGIVYFLGQVSTLDGLLQGVGEVRALSISLKGHTILEKAPPRMKARLDVWGPNPEAIDLMRRVKREFDPVGILNPGRFVGGI